MTKPKTGKKRPGPPKGVKGERIILSHDDVEKCETYGKVGLTLDQIAGIVGVSPTTLDEIIKRQPEVGRAIKKGRAQGIYQMGGTLFQRGLGVRDPKTKKYIEKPDTTAMIFYLKCQGRWVEARDQGENIKEDPYEPPDSIVDDDDD